MYKRHLLGKHVDSMGSMDSLAIRFTDAQLEAIKEYNSKYMAVAVRYFVSVGINAHNAKRKPEWLHGLAGLLYGGTI